MCKAVQLLTVLAIAFAGALGFAHADSKLIERKSKSHWAFQPVGNPAPPTVNDSSWPRSAIDHFILAKLESSGLTPSTLADRRTLIRRAYITLTGLPPAFEQTEAFVADKSPEAFAKVVDQLLASQYGERWARHWLDVARYADTKGYVFEEARQYAYAYTYRDWVIRSLNEDMPYDQFLIYQIAADKIASAEEDKKHLAAMGFLTLGRRFLNRQPDIIDDRIDVVTRGTMALTVACSRCHDHKYDPIPSADYYSLYGVFASSEEPKDLPLLGSQPPTAETEKFDRQLEAKQAKVDGYLNRRLEDQRSEDQLKNYLTALKDGNGMSDGELKKLASSRKLVQGILLRWRDHIAATRSDPAHPIFAPWNACFDLGADSFATEVHERLTPTLESPNLNPRIALALKDKQLESFADLAAAYAKLFAHDNQSQAHDDPDREQVRLVLHAPGSPTQVSTRELYRFLPTADQQHVRKLRREVESYKTNASGAPPRGMVMTDRPNPVEPYVFVRGQQGNRGPRVRRQFPAIVAGADRKPFPADSSGRLEMAQLIASSDNPLTARVIVNRIWLLHFGQPLVSTPSDFGLRSDPPTHPELLDFLANRFMQEGWSLKKLHRHLLLSATYQQSSASDPNKLSKDPENRLLWRMNRRRLDFEAMRDSLLEASGQLDPQMFGRPFKIAKKPFVNRRTIYSEIERQNLENIFRTFDFASPDAHCPQRHETTVPQQALFMMNSPFIGSVAAQIASSPTLRSQSPDADKIRHLYRKIFAREPEPEELQLGLAFVRQPDNRQTLTPWSFGYGSYEDGRVKFTPLPAFANGRWQGGPELPSATTGWASLHPGGGHPGHGENRQVILRWTAPGNGEFSLESNIEVPAQMSDGVIVNVIANGEPLIAERLIPATQKVPLDLDDLHLEKGTTLDLIVSSGPSVNHDSFRWHPTIKNKTTNEGWSLARDFTGPRKRISPWQQYAQALLATNEFSFVD